MIYATIYKELGIQIGGVGFQNMSGMMPQVGAGGFPVVGFPADQQQQQALQQMNPYAAMMQNKPQTVPTGTAFPLNGTIPQLANPGLPTATVGVPDLKLPGADPTSMQLKDNLQKSVTSQPQTPTLGPMKTAPVPEKKLSLHDTLASLVPDSNKGLQKPQPQTHQVQTPQLPTHQVQTPQVQTSQQHPQQSPQPVPQQTQQELHKPQAHSIVQPQVLTHPQVSTQPQGLAHPQVLVQPQVIVPQKQQELESKQQNAEKALAQNEKEKMDSILQKISAFSENAKAPTPDTKTIAGAIGLKTSRSFQLAKDKGNADDLRSVPIKKLKSDASTGNKPEEPPQTMPATEHVERPEEHAHAEGAEKADEASQLAKNLSTAKLIKPLVLTSPLPTAKQPQT